MTSFVQLFEKMASKLFLTQVFEEQDPLVKVGRINKELVGHRVKLKEILGDPTWSLEALQQQAA